MTRTLVVAGLCLLAVQGCATKHYGRQGALTDFERQTMSCREIELEEAKVQGFLKHVDQESEFDGRSVLSFLGDFGIGNVMEKDNATKSANERMTQLQATASQRGCAVTKPQAVEQPQQPQQPQQPTQ